uniref:Uncharacterized protein n=1 Tax=Acrobeloides nanus TaxID=290746 RepID=A0A914EAH6_9BILA
MLKDQTDTIQEATKLLSQPELKSMLATFIAMATNTQAQLQRFLDHLENGTTSLEISAEEKERKRSLVVSGIPESTKKSLHNKDKLAAIIEIWMK